jgi:hypothetical protein
MFSFISQETQQFKIILGTPGTNCTWKQYEPNKMARNVLD